MTQSNKSSFFISVPSKTFLMGEYAVLEGAPAILINTQPYFLFSITSQNHKGSMALRHRLSLPWSQTQQSKKQVQGKKTEHIKKWSPLQVQAQSPAGQWLQQYPEIKQAYHIKAYDPYKGQGGFGYSTAQFNVMYLLGWILDLYEKKTLNQDMKPEIANTININIKEKTLFSLWKAYRGLNFEGLVPSGADLISQWMGEVCVFYPKPFEVRSLSWPLPGLDFFLVRTGVTLNTHQHLNQIGSRVAGKTRGAGRGQDCALSIKILCQDVEHTFSNKNGAKSKPLSAFPKLAKCFADLTKISQSAVSCIETKNQQGFISALSQYSVCLKDRNLVHPKTMKLVQQISSLKEVIVARGCGAMGAEVVAVFFAPQDKEKVRAFLGNQNIVACSHHITSGLSLN